MDNPRTPSPDSDMWQLSERELRERFYDFPNIPLHVHLGITFRREDPMGPAIVKMPPNPEFMREDGTHSMAALYTIGEVSGGVAVSDEIVPHAVKLGMRPVVLTKGAEFSPKAPARGVIRGECYVAGDYDAAIARLNKRYKVDMDIGVKIYDEDDTLAGESIIHYYVRLMDESRLKSMAAMSPGMAGWAG